MTTAETPEMNDEQKKRFCEAWNIEPERWMIHGYYRLHYAATKEEAEKHFGASGMKIEPCYPPLTLELLLGVLEKNNVEFSIHSDGVCIWTRDADDEPDKAQDLEGNDRLTLLILAMQRFKGLEVGE